MKSKENSLPKDVKETNLNEEEEMAYKNKETNEECINGKPYDEKIEEAKTFSPPVVAEDNCDSAAIDESSCAAASIRSNIAPEESSPSRFFPVARDCATDVKNGRGISSVKTADAAKSYITHHSCNNMYNPFYQFPYTAFNISHKGIPIENMNNENLRITYPNEILYATHHKVDDYIYRHLESFSRPCYPYIAPANTMAVSGMMNESKDEKGIESNNLNGNNNVYKNYCSSFNQNHSSMFYFNPQDYGYNNSSIGLNPLQGYALVYPYVPMHSGKTYTGSESLTNLCLSNVTMDESKAEKKIKIKGHKKTLCC